MFEVFRQVAKKKLKESKSTYAEIAANANISEATVKQFMCGANDSRRVAEHIADVLNCTLVYSNGTYDIKDKEEESITQDAATAHPPNRLKGSETMATLRIIDTKDCFLVEVDGTSIPYVTTYELTRTVGDIVLLKLALSVRNAQVEVTTDKVDVNARIKEESSRK